MEEKEDLDRGCRAAARNRGVHTMDYFLQCVREQSWLFTLRFSPFLPPPPSPALLFLLAETLPRSPCSSI